MALGSIVVCQRLEVLKIRELWYVMDGIFGGLDCYPYFSTTHSKYHYVAH